MDGAIPVRFNDDPTRKDRLNATNPPIDIPGMVTLRMDTRGRLVRFGVVVAEVVRPPVEFEAYTLPKVLSVNLDGQHSTLLAGTIVANIISTPKMLPS